MRYTSETGAAGHSLIVAVEEPESHLHAEAIHGLKAVLQKLAEKHQVVITTHCAGFVERGDIGANIIVHRQKARPAKSINEIREILGVRAADNLRHADLILIVEGEDDVRAIKAILGMMSSKLKSALLNNTLAVESLGGSSNLAYKMTYLRNALCQVHCFLDNDKAGLEAVEKAKTIGLLADADYQFAICLGKHESEIEDFYEVESYKAEILATYAVSVDSPKFHSKKKWSDRMWDVFLQQGKHWDDKTEMAVKNKIADLVTANPAKALNQHRREPLQSLVDALLRKLGTTVDSTSGAINSPPNSTAPAPESTDDKSVKGAHPQAVPPSDTL